MVWVCACRASACPNSTHIIYQSDEVSSLEDHWPHPTASPNSPFHCSRPSRGSCQPRVVIHWWYWHPTPSMLSLSGHWRGSMYWSTPLIHAPGLWPNHLRLLMLEAGWVLFLLQLLGTTCRIVSAAYIYSLFMYCLELPMSEKRHQCTFCHSLGDPHGDHRVDCSGNRIHKHDSLCDAIFSAAQSPAWVPRKEFSSLIPNTQCWPTDIYLEIILRSITTSEKMICSTGEIPCVCNNISKILVIWPLNCTETEVSYDGKQSWLKSSPKTFVAVVNSLLASSPVTCFSRLSTCLHIS